MIEKLKQEIIDIQNSNLTDLEKRIATGARIILIVDLYAKLEEQE